MEGVVFNIQRFSLNDGPGIRTAVFLKGCPLRCIWCHNPESYRKDAEFMYDNRKCSLCGMCLSLCQCHSIVNGVHLIDRSACKKCMKCADHCMTGAIEKCGRMMHDYEVLAEVKKDAVFYETSSGGATLSGGEPMFQKDFALSLMKAFKQEGLHTAIETSGYAGSDAFREIFPYTDLFLFDIKETDRDRHKQFTGKDNEIILQNLFLLDSLGAEIVLRCPIIPGLNDRKNHFLEIARLVNRLSSVIRVDIEPYHPLGISKEERLGMKKRIQENIPTPTNEDAEAWISFIQSYTEKPVLRA